MVLLRDLYAIDDTAESVAYKISKDEAEKWNAKNYGIFWTVNEFNGPRRKDRLVRFLSFYCDIDDLPKEDQLKMIESGPYPSMVVESKRGYHVYWDIDEDEEMNLELYREIQERIVYHFGADKRAKDASRVLRVPGYYHCKDPNDKFMVTELMKLSASYKAKHMLYWFEPLPEKEDPMHIPRAMKQLQGNLAENLTELDNEYALERLSGKACVQHEAYTFMEVSGGKKNILVNGKGTSCFIDSRKRIGSMDGGGPTVWQWLKYFNYSHQEIYKILINEIPELFNESRSK